MTGHASDRQRIEPSLILPPQTLPAEPELTLPGLTPPVIAPVAEVPPPAEIKVPDTKSEPRLAEEDDLFVPGQSEPAKSPESEPRSGRASTRRPRPRSSVRWWAATVRAATPT